MQTFEEFKRLSEGANLVPVVRKLIADLETPVSVLVKGLNNIENIASSYAGTAFYGENYFDYGDLLMSVTKEELEKTLKNGFSASTLSVVSPSGEE